MSRGALRPGGRPPFTGLEAVGVSKSFGTLRALDDVSIRIEPGSIHALIGENGAGKSTLGKIISGVLEPDEGHVAVSGRAVSLRSPRDALLAGIATIEQEISLAANLTVRDNVFLGAEPRIAHTNVIDRAQTRRRWEKLQEASRFRLAAPDRVGALRLGERQQVEILRAISRQADLIVMDEPTAALSSAEVELLHDTVRSVVARGASVLIVTHFLSEVLELADTITVLRDGGHVRTAPASGESQASLINAMLGRDLSAVFPEKKPPAAGAGIVLRGRDIVAPGVAGVSLEVRAGEIVGLAGLDNSGRSEVARALYGDLPLSGGVVSVAGQRIARPSPRRSLARGLSMVPASRRDDGLFLVRPITQNASIGSLSGLSRAGIIRRRAEAQRAAAVFARLGVPADRGSAAVSTLSGGNQQKVLFARALLRETVALIAHEPTRGVDIGAKAAIYELLCSLAEGGMGVLLISSDPQELIGLSHRVIVMHRGRISDELAGADICEERILTAALTDTRHDVEVRA